MALVVKNPTLKVGDVRDADSTPGSGRSPGGGNGNPPQYSCLEIPWTEDPVGLQSMGITKSRTCLSTHAQTIVNNTALHI